MRRQLSWYQAQWFPTCPRWMSNHCIASNQLWPLSTKHFSKALRQKHFSFRSTVTQRLSSAYWWMQTLNARAMFMIGFLALHFKMCENLLCNTVHDLITEYALSSGHSLHGFHLCDLPPIIQNTIFLSSLLSSIWHASPNNSSLYNALSHFHTLYNFHIGDIVLPSDVKESCMAVHLECQ